MNSDFFKLDWKDIGHGFVNACLGALVMALIKIFTATPVQFPATWESWAAIIGTGLAAGLAYLVSKLPQNASGSYGKLPTGTTVTTPAAKTTV